MSRVAAPIPSARCPTRSAPKTGSARMRSLSNQATRSSKPVERRPGTAAVTSGTTSTAASSQRRPRPEGSSRWRDQVKRIAPATDECRATCQR